MKYNSTDFEIWKASMSGRAAIRNSSDWAGKAIIKSKIFEKLQKIVKIFGGFGTQNQLINAFLYIFSIIFDPVWIFYKVNFVGKKFGLCSREKAWT